MARHAKFTLVCIIVLLLSTSLLYVPKVFSQEQYTLTVVSAHGSPSPSVGDHDYDSGTLVECSVPSPVTEGETVWTCTGWTGTGSVTSGSGSSTSFTITADSSITWVWSSSAVQYTLTVNVVGSGSVTKSPDQATYSYGTVVTLTPQPAVGWAFSGWSGDLSGSANPGSITMNGNKTVTATFTQNQYILTVTVTPPAGGSVTSDKDPPYHYGDVVTLTESPALGYSFAGWSGDGIGSGSTRQVTITGNMAVTATFTQNHYTLIVNVVGTGCSVTKSPNQATYTYGTVVTLTPVAASGWTFSGWSGDLSGSANPGSITMNGNKTVTATFTQNQYILTVNVVGSGSVSLSPPGGTYLSGTVVQLAPVAASGWTFAGWSGDLSGSGTPGSIVMNGNKTVTATFVQSEYSLTVTVIPPAGGFVISDKNPPYHYGDVVTLRAISALGYSFAGWSGDGIGSGNTRQVVITGNMNVTATFTPLAFVLVVNVVGSGFVTKSPDQSSYVYGTVVTLTPVAAQGWTFSGWSGDLSGSGTPGHIAIDGNKVVTATFTQDAYSLVVSTVGSGSVGRNPDKASYVYGESAVLTAAPLAGWSFSGWSGDFSSSDNPITVIINGTTSVTATFTQNAYILTVNVGGSGSVSKSPNQASYVYGTVVTLTPFAAQGWTFSGWSGDLAGSGTPGSITMNGNKTVTATFLQSTYSLTVTSAYGNPSPVVGVHSYGSGASVTCSVGSPVTVGGTVWTCVGWTGTGSVPSSGSGLSTTFSISQNSSITWVWQSSSVQYSLTVVSAYGNPSPAVGSHSYSSGSYVTCSVNSPVTVGGKVWACAGWAGSGSVPSSGSGLSTTFSVTQDSSITWVWRVVQPERKLTVVSAHGSPNPTVGGHSYTDGQSVVCSVSSPVTENETTWVCTGWKGTGSVPSSGSGNNVSFAVAQDSSITWRWSESAPPLPPTLSSPADGEFISSSNVTFSWIGSIGATGYQIEINGSSKIDTVYSTSYSAYLDSGVHSWRVREYNSSGYGDWSLSRSFTVTVSMVGTESYYVTLLFGGLLATALIAYVFVFLKFGFVSERRRLR